MGFNLSVVGTKQYSQFPTNAQCTKQDASWVTVSSDSFQHASGLKFGSGKQQSLTGWLKKSTKEAVKTAAREAKFLRNDLEDLGNSAKALGKKIADDPKKAAAVGWVGDLMLWGGIPILATTAAGTTQLVKSDQKTEQAQFGTEDDSTQASSFGSETEAQRQFRELFLKRDSASADNQDGDALESVGALFGQKDAETSTVSISNKSSTETTGSLESETLSPGSVASTNPFDDIDESFFHKATSLQESSKNPFDFLDERSS